MPVIEAHNLVVEFPIYSFTGHRSFKKSLLNVATGGILAKDTANRVVVRALDNLSFRFHEGDRVGLIGHNGSGKTTLLQVLAGIYEPAAGDLKVKGRVTSMLGITLGMDSEVTGLENIYLRGRLMGLSRKQIDGMVDDIAEFAGIGDYLNLPLRTYSSGMAMRLAFAVATSVDADIILMDEWLSVGDAEFVCKAKERLTQIVGKARLVVLASHNHALVRDQCNIILTLEHGKIVSSERTDSLS
ncbi:MAG: Teichoic acids export ATP-binding protein TagH [Betaproteobacteria bacterium ADurb.Bin341]|nr:MAG: Teichoic acids export ATP-binding protein TagH [Betaproteobacteria bacterium ADurb.Bin341]